MKKTIIFTLAALAAATCLSACGNSRGAQKTEYDLLNARLNANYSELNVKIENGQLVSEYKYSYSNDEVKVNYSVQRFAAISLENPSNESITTFTGEGSYKNGAIVSNDDNLPATLAEKEFSFSEAYFENVEIKSLYFKADVKDANAFMGFEIECENMKVYATFKGDVMYEVKISYDAKNGNSVVYTYSFKA